MPSVPQSKYFLIKKSLYKFITISNFLYIETAKVILSGMSSVQKNNLPDRPVRISGHLPGPHQHLRSSHSQNGREDERSKKSVKKYKYF